MRFRACRRTHSKRIVADLAALKALYEKNAQAFESAEVYDSKGDAPNGSVYYERTQAEANKKLLDAAKAVLDKAEPTVDEIDAAYDELFLRFTEALTCVVDAAELEEELALSEKFVAGSQYPLCSEALRKAWDEAITTAKAVLANEKHTQNQCNAACEALADLPESDADKEKLRSLYNDCAADMAAVEAVCMAGESKPGTVYMTPAQDSENRLLLENTKRLLDDCTAWQSEVDTAFNALSTGYSEAQTEPPVNTSRLDKAIAYAEEFIVGEQYKALTPDTQKRWDSALAAAKLVRDDPEHTQVQCDAAANDIYTLVKTGEDSAALLLAAFSLLSLAALATVVIMRRKTAK